MLTAYKYKHINLYTVDFIISHLIKSVKVAKSTLYEWIKNYDLDNLSINDFSEKRKMVTINRTNKIMSFCENFICEEVLKNPIINIKKLQHKINDFF